MFFIIVLLVVAMLFTSGLPLPFPTTSFDKLFDSIFSNNGVTQTKTPSATVATTDMVFKINDLVNPSKSTTTAITTGTPATVYSNSITFGEKGSTYNLQMKNAIPVTYIRVKYTLLKPEGSFEIVVTDSKGQRKSEGIGRHPGASGGYDAKLTDEIKLFTYGDHTVTMTGYNVQADVTISYGK